MQNTKAQYPGWELKYFDRAYNFRNYQFSLIKKYIKKNVAEIGPGSGVVLKKYIKQCKNIDLYEPNKKIFRNLKKKFKNKKIILKNKIFKTYKNIVQTSGAAMINLLGCNPLTNFHIISHPSYSWSNLFLKNAADKLNVNFYEYDFGKLYGDVQSKCSHFDGNLSNINKPWEIINIQSLIDKLKR